MTQSKSTLNVSIRHDIRQRVAAYGAAHKVTLAAATEALLARGLADYDRPDTGKSAPVVGASSDTGIRSVIYPPAGHSPNRGNFIAI